MDCSPKSVLVVDDELLIRDLLYDFFTERNWSVSVCDSSDKALELLKTRRYDIALIDLKLPDSDGLALIGKIKAFFPDLPSMIVTGFPSLESAISAVRLKIDDYVVKPFNINKLYKAVDAIVESRRKAREEANSRTEDM